MCLLDYKGFRLRLLPSLAVSKWWFWINIEPVPAIVATQAEFVYTIFLNALIEENLISGEYDRRQLVSGLSLYPLSLQYNACYSQGKEENIKYQMLVPCHLL